MKRFLALILGGVMSLSLCACGGDKTPSLTVEDLDLTDTTALLVTLRNINDPMQRVKEDCSISVDGACVLSDGTASDFRNVYYLDEKGSLAMVSDIGYSGGNNAATFEGCDPDSDGGAFTYSCYILPDGTTTKALDVRYGMDYAIAITKSYGIPDQTEGIVTAESREEGLVVTIEETGSATDKAYSRAVKTFCFDPQTLLLKSDSTETYDQAGNRLLQKEANYAYLTDYAPAQNAMDLCKESETPCHVTLNYYPGEEMNQTVEFSVDRETVVHVAETAYLQTGTLYSDEACTQEMDGTAPLDLSQGDVTVYVKGI